MAWDPRAGGADVGRNFCYTPVQRSAVADPTEGNHGLEGKLKAARANSRIVNERIAALEALASGGAKSGLTRCGSFS
jgi:hypothetical protein